MLDPDACYAALQSRDRRFDGRFFVGVRTTGVFCRPVCPARTPRRDRVDFFPSAAAARSAGFRACLRCRPETAPQTAAWRGTGATVHRAVRLIEEGVLDRGSVEQLADRLGIGSRHLRGLFARHLGASPTAIAQGRRLRAARLLLQATELPMGEVAHLSGFSSVRRFNDAVARGFGRSPTALRAAGGRAEVEVRLQYRPPLDYDALLAYLSARAIPGIERVCDGAWHHNLALGGAVGTIVVRHAPRRSALVLTVPAVLVQQLPELVRRVRRALDLDADPEAVCARLHALSPAPGLRLPGALDPFAVAVRMILGQQISVAAATTLAGRLVEAWGPCVGGIRTFPAPEILAEAPLETIRLPRRRADTIRALARQVARGALSWSTPASLEALEAQLIALPGIGPWTAAMIAMRAFGEPDAFPAGDLVLRRALGPDGLQRAEAWRPWRAYAALTLWRQASEEDP